MPKLVWYNGTVCPLEEAKVPATDHAHLYGDGIFEGIRFYQRRVFRLDEHLDRLFHGIRFLSYEMPMTQAELRQIVLEVCAQADLPDGYIRLNVTRGTGLGLDPKNIDRRANVMVMVNTISLYPESAYEHGLDVVTCSIRVIPPDCLEPRLKCIGRYAANILAKLEANARGAGEGLMLNQQGQIAECTGDNLFLIQDRVIRTPHPSAGILQGITRDTVMHLARTAGYAVEECVLTPFDLSTADEAFLTGTAAEVIPMVTVDGRLIGNGKPGPVTRHLVDLFRAETANGVAF